MLSLLALIPTVAKLVTAYFTGKSNERISELQNIANVQIAEAGNAVNSYVRAAFALPFVIYINKLIIYDKILRLGTTDDLSTPLWGICGLIVGFYFVGKVKKDLYG